MCDMACFFFFFTYVSVENQDKYVFSWTDHTVLTLINKKDGAALNVNIYNRHLQLRLSKN